MDDPSAREQALSPALEALVRRYAEQVARIAGRHGLVSADLDEVFQLVRIRLWRALASRGTDDAIPASYVYRAARSAAVDVIRRRREWIEPLEPAVVEGAVHGPPGDPAQDEEVATIVYEELQRLAPDRQVAVRLHLEGYSGPDIARLMGWTDPRARHLIYRGLADLRARLRVRGLSPEDP